MVSVWFHNFESACAGYQLSLQNLCSFLGFAFSADGNFQREFEDAFEFEETADQNTAIADIKRDMERPYADGPAALRRRRLRKN